METKPNYYLVLGVSAACDDVVIHAAYRALMIKYHPDKNKDSNANYRSASINEAFKVIGSSSSRKLYDLSMVKTVKCCSCEFGDNIGKSSNKPVVAMSQNSISLHRSRKMTYSTMIYNIVLLSSMTALTVVITILIAQSTNHLGVGNVYATKNLPSKIYLHADTSSAITMDYDLQDVETSERSIAMQDYIDDKPQDISADVNRTKRF